METKTYTEDEFTNRKTLKIFGKDVLQIKCFRKSFIIGICGGITSGLLSFLVTSKALFSTHVGFGSLWVFVFAYWIPCRYQYESHQLENYYMKMQVEDEARLERQKEKEENKSS